ncbi:hypothetical protein ACQJBY_067180 [Aegilops geniculata]
MSTPNNNKKPLMFIQLARKSVEIHTGLMNNMFGIFVFAMAITTFTSNSSSTASSPAPSPPSVPGCDRDKMRGQIIMCERWLACFIVLSMISINLVRILIESAHEAHQWVAKEEEAAYNAARDAYTQACSNLDKYKSTLAYHHTNARDPAAEELQLRTAALKASQDKEDALVKTKKRAERERDRLVPKQGLERIEGWRLTVIRGLFFFAVLWSQISCGFAAATFYYSRHIESHCANGPLEILPFVLIGVVSLPYHIFLLLISLVGN